MKIVDKEIYKVHYSGYTGHIVDNVCLELVYKNGICVLEKDTQYVHLTIEEARKLIRRFNLFGGIINSTQFVTVGNKRDGSYIAIGNKIPRKRKKKLKNYYDNYFSNIFKYLKDDYHNKQNHIYKHEEINYNI